MTARPRPGPRRLATGTTWTTNGPPPDDLAVLTAHLNLKNVVHVGHSTGGGEVVHYLARHGQSGVAKAAIISAVPPLMVKTAPIQGACPRKSSTVSRHNSRPNRSQLYRDLPAGAFLWVQPVRRETLRGNHPELVASGHDGRREGTLRWIVAFSQTDFTDDLKKITVPVLVMHGDDDQIRPLRRCRAIVGEIY